MPDQSALQEVDNLEVTPYLEIITSPKDQGWPLRPEEWIGCQNVSESHGLDVMNI